MKTTSERLKEIMKERNLRQVDILNKSKHYQDELGIKMSKSHLSQYVNGKSSPDQHKLYLLSKTLNVGEAWLLGYEADKQRIPDNERQIPNISNSIKGISEQLTHKRQVKVYDFAKEQLQQQNEDIIQPTFVEVNIAGKLTAGYGSHNFDKEYPIDTYNIEAKDVPSSFDYAFLISGDSMYPTFCDNDIVYIEKTDSIQNSMIGAIEINGEAFLKKIYKRDHGLELISLNNEKTKDGKPLYPVINVQLDDDIRIIGKVVY